jgi:hypothetical protein
MSTPKAKRPRQLLPEGELPRVFWTNSEHSGGFTKSENDR